MSFTRPSAQKSELYFGLIVPQLPTTESCDRVPPRLAPVNKAYDLSRSMSAGNNNFARV